MRTEIGQLGAVAMPGSRSRSGLGRISSAGRSRRQREGGEPKRSAKRRERTEGEEKPDSRAISVHAHPRSGLEEGRRAFEPKSAKIVGEALAHSGREDTVEVEFREAGGSGCPFEGDLAPQILLDIG